MIQLVLDRMPAHGEALLSVIGSLHPDKAAAKAARKALFRLRGRLANQGSSSG